MKRVFTLFFMSFFIFAANAQEWSEVNKVTASDRKAFAAYGNAVELYGDYAVVGAYLECFSASGSDSLFQAGAAYVLTKSDDGIWKEYQKLVADDRKAGDEFGVSVDIFEDEIVIGARKQDFNVIGTDSLLDAGAAYVFRLNNSSGRWEQTDKLVSNDRGYRDFLAESVAIYEDVIVLGGRAEDEDELGTNFQISAGSAYIFEKNASLNYEQTQKIIAGDRKERDHFGIDVDLYKTRLVLGTSLQDFDVVGQDSLKDAGAVYVFDRQTDGVWKETIKLVASSREELAVFGSSVAIHDSVIVVGSYLESGSNASQDSLFESGAVYVFRLFKTTGWEEYARITPGDRDSTDRFGRFVAVDQNHIAVSAYYEDFDESGMDSLNNAGAIYLYSRADDYRTAQKVVTSDRDSSDRIGAVALSGSDLLVATSNEWEDADGENTLERAGSAYAFKFDFNTGLFSNDSRNSISFYPNPVSDVLNISFDSFSGNVEVIVSDLTGRRLLTSQGNRLDVSELSTGNYLITISDGEYNETHVFSKE